jgi:hypothetical protein
MRGSETIKRRALNLIAVFCMLSLSGCAQKVSIDKESSPVLDYVEIYAKNAGTEDSQQVVLNLFFDRAVKVNDKKKDSIRITIGKERIADEKYQVSSSAEPEKVSITIPVTAVTTGQMEVGISEKAEAMGLITDDSGAFAVQEFSISGVVPSGVVLQDVTGEDGQRVLNQKQVVSPFSIRSIAWLQLLDDGRAVEISGVPESEMLEDAVAVHGHEFLRDTRSNVAENITEIVNTYYGDKYEASCQDDIITIKCKAKPDAILDLKLYTYLKLNGAQLSAKAKEKAPAKMKIDRKVQDSEKAFLNAMHLTYKSRQDSAFGSGEVLYKTLRLTGKAIGEEQNYSVLDLETLVSMSFENNAMHDLGLVKTRESVSDENGDLHQYQGVDFRKLLELCMEQNEEESVYAECTWNNGTKVFRLDEIGTKDAEIPALIAFGQDGLPILPKLQGDTPLSLVLEDGTILTGISQIILDDTQSPKDPHYAMHHLREGYNASNDISLTLNLYEGEELTNTKTITTKELEKTVLSNPEALRRGYYGISGNKETFSSMENGGWLDYFEGIDLYWLICHELGEIDDSARFQFYDRDQKLYAQIEDSSYLKDAKESGSYYVMDREGTVIPQAVPMLAYGKNGYPLLKEHEHESAEYVAFNVMNHKLESKGIATELGVVKNHNGPFVAGLGNRDGIYGGSQKETGGDCVRIDIICD